QRSAQADVVVVGLEVLVSADATDTSRQLDTAQTTGGTSPAQLAVAILTVGQRQLHDFEVIGRVQVPVGDGVIIRAVNALTIVAGTSRDRAVRVNQADRSTVAAIGGRTQIHTINTLNRGLRVTVHQDGLEACEVGGGVLERVVHAVIAAQTNA